VKLAICALAALVLGATACQVNHRSGDFACTPQIACAAGRSCIDGFCVVPQLDAGLPIDGAPRPGADAAIACPSQCSSCDLDQHSCLIDCTADPDTCRDQVICPPGWDCNVRCSTANSCQKGVSCDGTTACTIACSGRQSCRDVACDGGKTSCDITCTGAGSCDGVRCGGGSCNVGCTTADSCASVTCGTGACTIGCLGNNSCDAVDCGDACACEVDCRINASCFDLTCKETCDATFGCTSTPAPRCNVCQ
jgi:hypothetical protein